jgi:hypothetical protein
MVEKEVRSERRKTGRVTKSPKVAAKGADNLLTTPHGVVGRDRLAVVGANN